MPRYIDADELNRVKFHPLPYTHITPADIEDAEAYERGWNDAIDAIIENTPTADVVERKKGRWKGEGLGDYRCSLCGEVTRHTRTNYCPNCGAKMEMEQ